MPPLLPRVDGVCDKCGAKDSLITRADDTKEIIEDRLEVYHQHTQPLIDFYSAKGALPPGLAHSDAAPDHCPALQTCSSTST